MVGSSLRVERSNLITLEADYSSKSGDCFVAPLLAKTNGILFSGEYVKCFWWVCAATFPPCTPHRLTHPTTGPYVRCRVLMPVYILKCDFSACAGPGKYRRNKLLRSHQIHFYGFGRAGYHAQPASPALFQIDKRL